MAKILRNNDLCLCRKLSTVLDCFFSEFVNDQPSFSLMVKFVGGQVFAEA